MLECTLQQWWTQIHAHNLHHSGKHLLMFLPCRTLSQEACCIHLGGRWLRHTPPVYVSNYKLMLNLFHFWFAYRAQSIIAYSKDSIYFLPNQLQPLQVKLCTTALFQTHCPSHTYSLSSSSTELFLQVCVSWIDAIIPFPFPIKIYT